MLFPRGDMRKENVFLKELGKNNFTVRWKTSKQKGKPLRCENDPNKYYL